MVLNYIHIPKNGGRSLLEYVKKNNDIKMTGTNVKFIFDKNNENLKNILLVIRDPIKRFISSFNHIKYVQYISTSGMKYASNSIKNRNFHKKYFDRYETPNELAEDLYSLDNHESAMEAFKNINIVKYMQHEWLQNINFHEIKIVLRLEHLSSDFKKYINPTFNLSKIGGELENYYQKKKQYCQITKLPSKKVFSCFA